PMKPSSPSFRTRSAGNSSASSYRAITGAISPSANSRAVWRTSFCSSVSSKSIAASVGGQTLTFLQSSPMRPGAGEHEDAVGAEEPGADAAVAREERVDQLRRLPHQLGRRRARPEEFLAGQDEEPDTDRQPPDHRSSPLTTLPFAFRGSASR